MVVVDSSQLLEQRLEPLSSFDAPATATRIAFRVQRTIIVSLMSLSRQAMRRIR